MSNNWQKDIHDHMGNYEIDAPEGLWDNISKEMGSKEISSKGMGSKSMGEANGDNKQTTKDATIFQHRFQRAVGIAVAACLAFVVGFYFYNSDDTTPTLADNSASQKTVTKQQYSNPISDNKDLDIDNNPTIGKDTEDNTIKTTQRLLAANREINGEANGEADVGQSINNAPENVVTAESQSTASDNNIATATVNEEKTASKEKPKANNQRESAHNENYQDLWAKENFNNVRKANRRTLKWQIGTSAAGLAGTSVNTRSVGDLIVATGSDGYDWEGSPMLGIGLYNQGQEVKTEYKHHLPVRIGLNIAYALSDRLSLESGVSYTRLSSDMKDGTSTNFISGSQNLDYVGIPLSLKYKALSYGAFDLYASTGILAEQCVNGKMSKDFVIENNVKKSEQQNIHSRPLQLSANAAVGLQFKIADNIGIYAEPGLSYFFDDNSSLNTIYKEKPLNFNLNIGFRYEIKGKVKR